MHHAKSIMIPRCIATLYSIRIHLSFLYGNDIIFRINPNFSQQSCHFEIFYALLYTAFIDQYTAIPRYIDASILDV